MIAYRAACPNCRRDCWWYGYPVQEPLGHQSSMIQVKCHYCDADDRASGSQTNELVIPASPDSRYWLIGSFLPSYVRPV